MLHDGIRKLNINVCTRNGITTLCSYSEKDDQHNISFEAFMDEVLDYVRQVFHQVIVIKIDSIVENPDHIATFQEMEFIIDNVCQLQTGHTAGLEIEDYIPFECPFIFVQPDHEKEWATLGEVIDHYPGFISWDGDGEDDGVQSKIIITNGKSLPKKSGDRLHYFSRVFSRNSYQPNQQPSNLKEKIHKLCQSPKPIALQAHYNKDFSTTENEDSAMFYDADYIEDVIFSESGCNLNKTPKDTYFNSIEVNMYDQHNDISYLKDLQRRMNKHNYEKFLKTVTPVKEEKMATKYDRHDEL
ncbi:unnamed protein product [Cunninghamella echinulata]